MSTELKLPLTNIELADAGGLKGPLYFPASFDEYWELLAKAEYRVDYYDRQIIASMSYESDLHSHLATQLTALLTQIFSDYTQYRVFNSNRPVHIENCPGTKTGVFNPDGMVTTLPAVQYEHKRGLNAEKSPVFLFEILSESTRAYDLGTKLPCYKKIPGLNQILYLEQNKPSVFVYERETANRWSETELSSVEANFILNGQSVSVGQLYRGIY